MRKRIVRNAPDDVPDPASPDRTWLDLERLARVEITSEDPGHPIEAALIPGRGSGWRASPGSGEQIIRLLFDEPQRLERVRLVFDEQARERTQEFALLWLRHGESSYREIVRQQYHFGPPATTREVEDYQVDLEEVDALELRIVPHVGGGDAVASLTQLRLA